MFQHKVHNRRRRTTSCVQQEFNNNLNKKYTFQHDPSKMTILAYKQPHVCDLHIRSLMTYLLLRENEKNVQSGLNIAPWISPILYNPLDIITATQKQRPPRMRLKKPLPRMKSIKDEPPPNSQKQQQQSSPDQEEDEEEKSSPEQTKDESSSQQEEQQQSQEHFIIYKEYL